MASNQVRLLRFCIYSITMPQTDIKLKINSDSASGIRGKIENKFNSDSTFDEVKQAEVEQKAVGEIILVSVSTVVTEKIVEKIIEYFTDAMKEDDIESADVSIMGIDQGEISVEDNDNEYDIKVNKGSESIQISIKSK